MKKNLVIRALLVLITLALAISLAACGGSKNDSGTGSDDGGQSNPCAHGHIGIEERIVSEGSCTVGSIVELWCYVCGDVIERKEEDPYDHMWEETGEISPATCESAQILEFTCKRQFENGQICGATQQMEGEPALDHEYVFNDEYQCHMCTMCSLPQLDDGYIFSDSAIYYKASNDGEVELASVLTKELTSFTVPETVNGAKVVSVSAAAFSLSPNLEELNLPETITYLDAEMIDFLFELNVAEYENGYYYAGGDNPYHFFLGMIDKEVYGEFILHPDVVCIFGNGFEYSNISSVDLHSAKHFDWNTFRGCKNIESVTIPDGVTELSCYMFASSSIKTLTLPEGVTRIPPNAFEYSAIETIDLSNVTVISEWAFRGASNLRSVILSDKLESISYYAFRDCTSLSVVVPDSVTEFADDCFLKTKDVSVSTEQFNKNRRYFIGASKLTLTGEGTVPAGSFNGLYLINEIVFDGVTRVMPYAIIDCPNLTSVTFGNGISKVEAYTVFNCPSLNTLVFSEDVREVAEELFMKSIPGTTSSVANENAFTVTTEGGCTYYSNGENLYYALADVEVNGELVLPDGVTLIMSGIFTNSTNVSSLTVPDSLRFISDEDASWNKSVATNIDSTYYVGSATNPYMILVEVGGSHSSYTVQDGVKFILSYAFNGTGVSSVIMNDGVLQIKRNGLVDLTSATLPDRLGAIGRPPAPAETVGTEIGEINGIPEGLLYLPLGAKFKLPQDKSFINDGTYYISKNAFSDETVFTEYGEGFYIGTESNPYYALIKVNTGATQITIHEDTVLIAEYALSNCDAISAVTIPDSVMYINAAAFYGCESLQIVTIGTGVLEIGHSAFAACTNLEKAYIGSNVRIIRSMAFAGCKKLTELFIPDSVIVCENHAFDCVTLYCDMNEKPKYFSDYWCHRYSDFRSSEIKWNSTRPY